MKITVSTRIIGGFTIITLMLVILGVVAEVSLTNIGKATEEVNSLAIPTVSSSSNLKVSFLNMGRLTTGAFNEKTANGFSTQKLAFEESQSNFDKELRTLSNIVSKEQNLRESVVNTDNIYRQYIANVNTMFDNKSIDLEFGNKVLDMLSDIEDNADDASTVIVDFADLDEVQDNSSLLQASEIANGLESNLSTLITVAAEFVKTESLTRADTIGNEVNLVVGQIQDKVNQIQTVAGDRDKSDSLSEMYELIGNVTESITSSNGLIKTQVKRLNSRNQSEQAYAASEENIQNAIQKLNELLALANSKAKNAEEEVANSVSWSKTIMRIIGLVSVIIAAGIAYRTRLSIVKPLYKVNEILNVVSTGDLTQKLEISSQDEFGDLANNCNNLIESLKSLISAISSRAAQLAAAAEETSAVSPTAQTACT